MKCNQACRLFDQAQQDCDMYSANAEIMRKAMPILEKTAGVSERMLASMRDAISSADRLQQEARDRMEQYYPIMMAKLRRNSLITAVAATIVTALFFCFVFPFFGAIEFADGYVPPAIATTAFVLLFGVLSRLTKNRSGSGWLHSIAVVLILLLGFCSLQSFGLITILDSFSLICSFILTMVANWLVPPTVHTFF